MVVDLESLKPLSQASPSIRRHYQIETLETLEDEWKVTHIVATKDSLSPILSVI